MVCWHQNTHPVDILYRPLQMLVRLLGGLSGDSIIQTADGFKRNLIQNFIKNLQELYIANKHQNWQASIVMTGFLLLAC